MDLDSSLRELERVKIRRPEQWDMSLEKQTQTAGSVTTVVGLTMGDAAGIGAEIVLKTAMDPEVRKTCIPVVIGDLDVLRSEADLLGIDVRFRGFKESSTDEGRADIIVCDLANLKTATIRHGVESAEAGKAAAEYIEKAVELWRSGRIDAITTAPINKRSLQLGGYDFPGHTEFLASLTNTDDVRMSFMAGNLRVVLLSTHVSLGKAVTLVTRESMVELIRFSERHLSFLLDRGVSLAVAGLNPHASEGGMFGEEEEKEIIPAVEECRNVHGINVSGPYSPDTIFLRGFKGEFDGVISCYHDQATIAVKCLSFGESVNVTLGLPLIRTSVDHGTAFDIAGMGIADHSSLCAAVKMAADFAIIQRGSSTRRQFC